MASQISLRPAARLELRDAHDWYERQKPGLGAKFFRAVATSLDRITQNPELFPLVHANVRRCILKPFPFLVLYLVDAEEIVVISIFHSSRDPRIWRRRL